MSRWLPLALLAWFTVQGQSYIGVFQSNPRLWAHAERMAPQKPRVVLNAALMRFQAGDLQGGAIGLERAVAVAQLPHVPAADRAMTMRTVRANLEALRR